MNSAFPKFAFICAFGGVALVARTANAASPDLVPIPSRLVSTGTVSIQNAGDGPAAPSVATVNCHKVGHVGPGGGCPELPPHSEYSDPAYPDVVVVHIPKIKKGHVYSVGLSFWSALVWPPGDYTLTITADAGNAVAESNEGNNTASGVKHSP